jgi:hypothetical protein
MHADDAAIIRKVMEAGELLREAVSLALEGNGMATQEDATRLAWGFSQAIVPMAAIVAFRGVEGGERGFGELG